MVFCGEATQINMTIQNYLIKQNFRKTTDTPTTV